MCDTVVIRWLIISRILCNRGATNNTTAISFPSLLISARPSPAFAHLEALYNDANLICGGLRQKLKLNKRKIVSVIRYVVTVVNFDRNFLII